MKYALFLAALLGQPAIANERTLTVTDFDRIRVEGGFVVDIVTNRGPSARISGSEQAIERTNVEMQGRTLVIRGSPNAWGGWQGASVGIATIHLTTPGLRGAASIGASMVRIDRMRAQSVTIAQSGSGSLRVNAIEADTLDAALAGAGTLTLAGHAAQTRLIARGSGVFDGIALAASDLHLVADGSVDVKATATRSASVIATGAASVQIAGRPACTVDNRGNGTVTCGVGSPR